MIIRRRLPYFLGEGGGEGDISPMFFSPFIFVDILLDWPGVRLFGTSKHQNYLTDRFQFIDTCNSLHYIA